MAKKVRDAMTPEPRVADPSLSLAEAAQLMKSEDIGSLPVVQEGQLVAVLTDRDIVVRAVAESADPSATKVGDIASRKPVTIEPDEDLDEALAQMARAQADIAQEAKSKQAGELVEEISKSSGPAA